MKMTLFGTSLLFVGVILLFSCDPLVWEDYEPIEDMTGTEEPGEEEPGEEMPEIQDSSLIFWAKDFFNLTAIDSSVYRVNGTFGSEITVVNSSSRNEGSFLEFNDAGELLLPSVELDTFSQLTFSMWLRSYAGGSETLLLKGMNSSDLDQEKFEIGNDRLRLGSEQQGVDNICFVNENLLTGEWKMLTIVVPELNDGAAHSGYKVYINGIDIQEKDSCQLNGIITTFSQAVDTRVGTKFDGEIDNIRIYDRVLSKGEIDSIHLIESIEFSEAVYDFVEPENLISYYTFDHGVTSPVVIDFKEGINGVPFGPFAYTDATLPLNPGLSADFSVGSSYWKVEDSYLDKINSFSTSFWIKTNAEGYEPLIVQGISQNNYHGIILSFGKISCGIDDPYNFNVENFPELVLDNEWHLITLVCQKINQDGNSGNMRIYIDAVPRGMELDFSELVFTDTSALYVGTENNGGFFTGQMDNIRFYNKELTQTEIDTIYQSERE